MGHGEEGSCAHRSVLKFKLKIPDHKIIPEKRKAGRVVRRVIFEQFRGGPPIFPFHVPLLLDSLFRAILLENNDLCRRRPYGRARDRLLSP